jgi:hypothetical protein
MKWVKHICIASALMAGLCSTNTLKAQLIVEGAPIWTSTNIVSVGGITYFVNTGKFYNCSFQEYGTLTMASTNFALPVTQMRNSLCTFCFDCYVVETNATVLGNLPGGNYRLSILSRTTSPPFLYELTRTMDFVVPADSGPTMTISRQGNGVQIAVNGVAAATYTVQASTTSTNWTTLTNVTGAPFTFTANLPEGSSRFYRVSVASGSVSSFSL